MRNNNRPAAALLFLMLVVFFIGIVKLFLLRFAAGDVYPEYSSLRADPLGTKGLYESLSALNRCSVSRNFERLSKERSWHDVTLLYLGMDSQHLEFIPENELAVLDEAVAVGARVVITLPAAGSRGSRCEGDGKTCRVREQESPQPETSEREGPEDALSSEGEVGAEERTEEEDNQDDYKGVRLASLSDHWGFTYTYDANRKEKKDAYKTEGASYRDLPNSIPWHTLRDFGELGESWRIVYTCNARPALIERSFGKGTIVLCADTYLLSNEAMRHERYPHLLAWLVGPNAEVVFDETHLGIRKASGVAVLARKYQLHWLVGSLVLIAALFVWKNTICFVPPRKRGLSRPGSDATPKRDYAEGLISLLRRNISKDQILSACVEEWERSPGSRKRPAAETVKEVRAIAAAKPRESAETRDPVTVYQSIHRMLTRKERV